jgi:hypothetical protein
MGLCSFSLLLVLMLCTSILDVNISWFCDKNFISDKIYWEGIVSIPNDDYRLCLTGTYVIASNIIVIYISLLNYILLTDLSKCYNVAKG